MSKAPGQIRYYEGAVAIVTGGASGIGAALTRALVKAGAHVIIGDLQEERAQEVARSVSTNTARADTYRVDVTKADSVEALVDIAFRDHGRLDFIFNNAGIAIQGEAQDYTLDDWQRTIDVNLNGVYYGIAAAYPRMIDQGFGHIVNTASAAGHLPMPLGIAYSASKFAVVGMTRSLRAEATDYGVRVSALCPGFVETPILTGGEYGRVIREVDPETARKRIEQLQAMSPDEFAERVLRRLQRNHCLIVEPFRMRLMIFLNRVSHRLSDYISLRIARYVRRQTAKDTNAARR